LYTERVRGDQGVETQDEIHLRRSDQSTPALSNNVGNYKVRVTRDQQISRISVIRRDLLAETLDSFDVKGAAHEASPSLILGGSFSSSISAS
jgi:hypothetical protein